MGTGTRDMNVTIGTDFSTGDPIAIDTSKHINLEGMSGVGKSTTLVRLFIEHIRQGNGGVFIDPHGDTADQLATLIPKGRMRDFIWIDPDATHVPGLNIFDYDDPRDKELGVESFITMMKALAGSAWGDETARVLTNAADAIVEQTDRPTAIPIFRFMADDAFRKSILAKSENPLLRMFKEQYDDKLRESEQMSKFSPPINKVGKLLRPSIIPIIGQPKSLDFLEAMNSKKIVVCRFSKGRLGEEVSQILGSLVVSMVSISALKRERQKKRPPFMLVADEVHNFVHGGRFGTLLAESRKYGITLVMASQGMYQLPFAKDIQANCSTQIVFNVSGEDAQAIADNWRWIEYPEELRAADITALPRYAFYCRTFVDDTPMVVKARALQVTKRGDEANPTKLIKSSLERWGKRKKEVLLRIGKFLSDGSVRPSHSPSRNRVRG
jgi:DNA helicase HerA-like ATPase